MVTSGVILKAVLNDTCGAGGSVIYLAHIKTKPGKG